MVDPNEFLLQVEQYAFHFFAGVPDSLMKGFLTCLNNRQNHFVTANEGAALAMAAGYHLATGQTGLVYLQNSGLGNLINPLTSLADKEVYGIPMLLMIGWRGRPGIKDEPQHKKMGTITTALLDVLEVPYVLFRSTDEQTWMNLLNQSVAKAQQLSQPVALVFEEGFFDDTGNDLPNEYALTSEVVLESIIKAVGDDVVIVANTGRTGRLFYQLNKGDSHKIKKYFLNVGAMGHASSIAAGLAKFSQHRVVLLDGDGSLLMHMGSLAVIGSFNLSNLSYIVLNNGAHQSVGGQKTVGFSTDFCSIAKACGFKDVGLITGKSRLDQWLLGAFRDNEFVEIRINTHMPENLPRPAESFVEAKQQLMKEVKSD
jgi:phosphonopyruvate decarboxylase